MIWHASCLRLGEFSPNHAPSRCDLDSHDFTFKLVIAHCAENPLHLAMVAMQALSDHRRVQPRYVQQTSAILRQTLVEYAAMLEDSAIAGDAYWGLLVSHCERVAEADAQHMDTMGVLELARHTVYATMSEVCRRFGHRMTRDVQHASRHPSLACKWMLLHGMLNSPPEAESTERVDCLMWCSKQVHDGLRDGFTEKVLSWFVDDAEQAVRHRGRVVDSALYAVCQYVDALMPLDVQRIESLNSTLRIIQNKSGPAMSADLFSSRHVIRHNSASIITERDYTADMQRQANAIAKRKGAHERFTVPLMVPSSLAVTWDDEAAPPICDVAPAPSQSNGHVGCLIALCRKHFQQFDVTRTVMPCVGDGAHEFRAVRTPSAECETTMCRVRLSRACSSKPS